MARPGRCSVVWRYAVSWYPRTSTDRPRSAWCGHQTRRNTFRMDMPTATAMPGSTPSRATLRNATRASTKSERRCRRSRRSPAMSASERDAAMTTAASAGCGRSRSRPGATSSMVDDRGGSDESGDLGSGAALEGDRGARSAGADREALEEPGGDAGRSDAHHLAVPVDLGAGLVGEHGCGRDGVGEGDQGDAERAGEQQGQILERHGGEGERREPGRQLADEGDSTVLEVEHGNGSDREYDGGENAREDRPEPLKDEDQRQARRPDRQRGTDCLAALDRLTKATAWSSRPSASTENPNSLGS